MTILKAWNKDFCAYGTVFTCKSWENNPKTLQWLHVYVCIDKHCKYKTQLCTCLVNMFEIKLQFQFYILYNICDYI